MSKSNKYRFGTKAIHAGVEPDSATGAIMTPIYQTSTYVQSAPGEHKGYEYSRSQNPTRKALENSIAALENAEYGHCFASGLAAIDAVIKTLKPGDEVISTNDLYGGSYRIFTKIFQDFGIHFHFIDMSTASNIEKHMTEKTKLIWVETPTNPMMNIIDIKAAADIAKKHKVLLCVDNTFSTPYLQNPLDLGADLVMHSLTKYIAGHSDVIMGALATNNKDLSEKLAFIQKASGAVPGPQDCFLVLRGIKTLHLRMQRHCENGSGVANFLKTHPKVDKVLWPGFKSHPNHEIASRQMHDFGGMISFSLKENTKAAATEILRKFELFTLAESLGGVESLSGHPATMTHASIPKAERDKIGLSDSLIRLSVGVEDLEDLIQDLKQALS
ncbi:cystathionine gamma-synthase [Marivirga sp.]|uniref:cystathionine gamma-synthase n=1 Tax=Marivirga sp. TaxID=2018662 RepID=UPI002D8035E8|nr:cystathionine gamma-synthase [Marivirga sp.]HET8860195.1 cystathionine gamma-synthase [Marivirga sp.]